jgi:hypothetical protein
MARDRITINHLRRQADHLNKLTNNPTKPYIDGEAQIGNYSISCAYGGYSLEQIISDGGGVIRLFNFCHVPARELFGLIRAYTDGLEAGRKES